MKIISALFIVLILSGCAVERANMAASAKTQMIGMSKEDVLTCMGTPMGKSAEGHTEVWTWGSGGETDTTGVGYGTSNFSGNAIGNSYYGAGSGSAIGISKSRARYCTINIVFKGGVVKAVNYSGRTGGLLSAGEQCAYALQNCVQQ